MPQLYFKKANILSDLEIDEVSIVDGPANSEIDPITGRKIPRAIVALIKRDSTCGEYKRSPHIPKPPVPVPAAVPANNPNRKKSKKSRRQIMQEELTQIAKSARTRGEFADAVAKYAKQIVAKRGGNAGRTEARIWEQNPELQMHYEALPLGKPKYDLPTREITKAEAILDERARTIQKRDPTVSYPSACATVLQMDPHLYASYEKELAAGQTYTVPDIQKADLNSDTMGRKGRTKQDEYGDGTDDGVDEGPLGADAEDGVEGVEDDGECESCGSEFDEGDRFCPGCGDQLVKPTSKKAKTKATAKRR